LATGRNRTSGGFAPGCRGIILPPAPLAFRRLVEAAEPEFAVEGGPAIRGRCHARAVAADSLVDVVAGVNTELGRGLPTSRVLPRV